MLIPSIDLKGGQVVQLVQGERPALATDDIDAWVDRFRGFPRVQLIDLDAATGLFDISRRSSRAASAAASERWRARARCSTTVPQP